MLGAAQVTKGRPPKLNVIRDESGKSRGEPEIVDPTRLWYRARELKREGLAGRHAKEHASNALAGHSLGRLLLRHQTNPQDPGAISREQYDAGSKWTEIIHRHASIMGYSLGSPKAPSFIMVSGGLSCATAPTDEQIGRIRDQFKVCYNALAEASKSHGSNVQYATYAVCVQDRPLSALTTADYGALRIGLNVLARALR